VLNLRYPLFKPTFSGSPNFTLIAYLSIDSIKLHRTPKSRKDKKRNIKNSEISISYVTETSRSQQSRLDNELRPNRPPMLAKKQRKKIKIKNEAETETEQKC